MMMSSIVAHCCFLAPISELENDNELCLLSSFIKEIKG